MKKKFLIISFFLLPLLLLGNSQADIQDSIEKIALILYKSGSDIDAAVTDHLDGLEKIGINCIGKNTSGSEYCKLLNIYKKLDSTLPELESEVKAWENSLFDNLQEKSKNREALNSINNMLLFFQNIQKRFKRINYQTLRNQVGTIEDYYAKEKLYGIKEKCTKIEEELIKLVENASTYVYYPIYKPNEWYWGINGGSSLSTINNIQNTIISSQFPVETYGTNDKKIEKFEDLLDITATKFEVQPLAALSFYYRFKNTKLAIQPEISYSTIGNHFRYCDVLNLQYDINIKYRYLNNAFLLKCYPINKPKKSGRKKDERETHRLNNLYLLIGPEVGLNLTNSNLTYRYQQGGINIQDSTTVALCNDFATNFNLDSFEEDELIENNLIDVLEGKSNISLSLGIGYDFFQFNKGKDWGFNWEFRSNIGLNDIIGVNPNGFGFSEEINRSTSFSLRFGIFFPVKNRYQ